MKWIVGSFVLMFVVAVNFNRGSITKSFSGKIGSLASMLESHLRDEKMEDAKKTHMEKFGVDF